MIFMLSSCRNDIEKIKTLYTRPKNASYCTRHKILKSLARAISAEKTDLVHRPVTQLVELVVFRICVSAENLSSAIDHGLKKLVLKNKLKIASTCRRYQQIRAHDA